MKWSIPVRDSKEHPPKQHRGPHDCGGSDGPCGDVVDLTRLRYFHGQALSAADLRREQSYFLDKARLRNRLLHGWGIVCGLEITVETDEKCVPAQSPDDAAKEQAEEDQAAKEEAQREKAVKAADAGADAAAARVAYSHAQPSPAHEREPDCPPRRSKPCSTTSVHPGAAIDCDGNEIIIRNPRPLHLDALLSDTELRELAVAPSTVYLTLCYHEEFINPARPLLTATCEAVPACEYAGVRECFRICATTDQPDSGPRCEPCCGACGERCIELVAITNYSPGSAILPEQLDFSGRRMLARHELTEIVGVNWVHGATYTREDATRLLDDGIEVVFSEPVRIATLQPGVVELRTLEGGAGRSANIYGIDGAFHGLPSAPEEYTTRLTFKSTTDETLQYGDRVMIVLRGDFVLDECCRAVDADHIGGSVPRIEGVEIDPIAVPPRVCPPRPTGNGNEGGEFVSWIFVEERSVR